MLQQKGPTLFQSLIPIIFLVGMLVLNVIFVYGDNALGGANQMTLLFSAVVAGIIAISIGVKWNVLLEGMVKSISSALPALIILLLIGSLAGTWLISGIVPAMIYYGLEILHPSIFLFASCLICAIVSLATGSSWSTVATVGIALLGIGTALGMSEGVVAGAIISGAYFGDKMSPLSDTTNLAPAMAGTDLITHIRYMMWTTIPSFTLSLIGFLILGFFFTGESNPEGVESLQSAISNKFNISGWLFLVPLAVIGMIVKKVPAIPALFFGAILGAVFAIIFQPDIILEKGSRNEMSIEYNDDSGMFHRWHNDSRKSELWDVETGDGFVVMTNTGLSEMISYNFPADIQSGKSIEQSFDLSNGEKVHLTMKKTGFAFSSFYASINAMTGDMSVETGEPRVDDLLSTGGMNGMLGTIWLIICAMCFGGIMECTGMLSRITRSILRLANSNGSLIATTAGSCLTFNLTASDQYLAIVVPGRMFAKEFENRNLAPEVLSRTLEDTGTVTSALIPWNTCGAYHAGVLQVATGTYLPYCFFNLISPVMTVLFGYLNIKIRERKKVQIEK